MVEMRENEKIFAFVVFLLLFLIAMTSIASAGISLVPVAEPTDGTKSSISSTEPKKETSDENGEIEEITRGLELVKRILKIRPIPILEKIRDRLATKLEYKQVEALAIQRVDIVFVGLGPGVGNQSRLGWILGGNSDLDEIGVCSL